MQFVNLWDILLPIKYETENIRLISVISHNKLIHCRLSQPLYTTGIIMSQKHILCKTAKLVCVIQRTGQGYPLIQSVCKEELKGYV